MTQQLQRFLAQLRRGLDSLLEPAEDPRQAFAYTYQRQRQLLEQVRNALAGLTASKNHLEAKAAAVRDKLPQLERQARQALLDGREDLARLSLRWHQIAAIELQTLEQQVRDVQQERDRLALTEQRLATQIETFFARQEIITARYSAAEAQVHINEALGGVSQELSDLGRALQKTEQKTETMQARASAIDRLIEEGVLEVPGMSHVDTTADALGQFDVTQAVEDRLETLKREMHIETKPSSAEPPG
ncbi:MAG TPA: PspA/IM30 family protein [Aggregatilineaceae bacterium]|nr:PspA/IM30 family protein [Aggregatilineaceae bacterium]